MKTTISCGNVFKDMGLPDAENLKRKSGHLCRIADLAKRRGVPLKEVAEIVGTDEDTLCGALSGKLDLVTADTASLWFDRLNRHVGPPEYVMGIFDSEDVANDFIQAISPFSVEAASRHDEKVVSFVKERRMPADKAKDLFERHIIGELLPFKRPTDKGVEVVLPSIGRNPVTPVDILFLLFERAVADKDAAAFIAKFSGKPGNAVHAIGDFPKALIAMMAKNKVKRRDPR